ALARAAQAVEVHDGVEREDGEPESLVDGVCDGLVVGGGSAGRVVVTAGDEFVPFGACELPPGDLAGVAGERLGADVPEVCAPRVVACDQVRVVRGEVGRGGAAGHAG